MVKTVLPVVDYVFLERRAKPSSRRYQRGGPKISARMPVTRKIERGMAKFEDIIRVLKSYSQKIEKPLPYMVYSKKHSPSSLRQGLQDIELENPEKFVPLTPDELTDVNLDGGMSRKSKADKKRS